MTAVSVDGEPNREAPNARRWLVAFAFTVLTCCGELEMPSATPSPAGATSAPTAAAQTGAPTGAPTANEGAERVVHDLASQHGSSELREDGAHVVDLGTPGAPEHPLANWRSPTTGDQIFEGATTTVVPRRSALVLPPMSTLVASRGAIQFLSFRARAFDDGRLTILLDGAVVSRTRLPSDGSFGIVSIPIDVHAMWDDEHILEFHLRSRDPSEGMAIDWFRLGWPHVRTSATPPQLRIPTGEHLPRHWSRSWRLELPTSARLVADVEGEVEVVAASGSTSPQSLGRHHGRIDIDLSAFAGDARLEIRATQSSTIRGERIVQRVGRE